MIIKACKSNLDDLVRLALKLWPDNNYEDLFKEYNNSINEADQEAYIYQDKAMKAVGFIQLSIRYDYVEGSSASPVAYIEGIYISESERRKGIGNELVDFAEAWAAKKGCCELASDCELDNVLSIDFHKGIGFREANRLVCFIKKIKTKDA
jgi:aminoglycoside 6'-N-acetyltransferase I